MLDILEQTVKRLADFSLMTADEEMKIEQSLLWIEMNLRQKTDYLIFIEKFNEIADTKFKPDVVSRRLFYENSYTYSIDDRLKALRNILKNPFFEDKRHVITLKYVCEPENIAKYMNYTAPKEAKKEVKNQIIDNDYEVEI